jgi:segregation and condensation protein B
MMSLKAKIEAIIYAAEEPVTVDQMLAVVADEISIEHAAQPAEGELPVENASDITTLSESQVDTERAQTLTDAKLEAKQQRDQGRRRLRETLEQLITEYDSADHGMEIRQVAGGYRMSTKPEHHDVVRSFAKSLKAPMRLSLQALETLAVIAYKQPVTAPEISEIRGVDSSGVLAGLISRKLITTAGRKQVIGRPILYKTTKDFLLRFGLNDLNELPSIEEFEKLTSAAQSDLFAESGAVADATGVPDSPSESDTFTNASAENQSSDSEGHYRENVVEFPRPE